ncbi:MAG: Gfo/Idh/MocA family oxidoreductase, partial [Gemmatales bacterium]|nr:Gfo/Idh/MocA family oxidoreductase [Gemmatales bacterium]
ELPRRVFACAQYEFGVDISMTGILEFGEGRTASFDCSFVWPFRQALEIVGTRGRIRIPDMWLPPDPAVFVVETEDGYAAEIAVSGVNQIAAMLDDFSQAVLHQRSPEPSPENAVQVMQVLDALRESAQVGQPIMVR